MSEVFRRVAARVSEATGSPWAFILALAVIAVWAVSGPVFGYSDTWQLVINTGTTIVTFLMVFLIQNTQNRDSRALHLKLDELIRGVEGARTRLVDLEEMTDDELDQLQDQFRRMRDHGAAIHAHPPASGEVTAIADEGLGEGEGHQQAGEEAPAERATAK
jgi:low affinity Fe/Cu permease